MRIDCHLAMQDMHVGTADTGQAHAPKDRAVGEWGNVDLFDAERPRFRRADLVQHRHF
jgi:hypothetical protein